MKKWLKILLATVLALVAIPFAVVALLQAPKVQNAICDKVTGIISEKTGADISIGQIHFSPFDRVILDDVYYGKDGNEIVSCHKMALDISPVSILKKDFVVKRISAEGGTVNLSNLPTKEKEEERDTAAFSLPQIKAHIKRILVDDFNLIYYNSEADHPRNPEGPDMIDFNDISISDIHIDIRDVNYDGKSASASVRNISMKEQCGFEMKDLSCYARYDTSGISLKNVCIRDKWTSFNLDKAILNFDSFDDFSDFTTNVRMDVSFDNTVIDLTSLRHFAPKVNHLNLRLGVDGDITGTLSDIQTQSLRITSSSGETFLDFRAHLIGLPAAEETMASFDINKSRTNTKDISEIVYQVTKFKSEYNRNAIAQFAPGVQFSFDGSLNGFFTDFVAYGALNSKLGAMNVDILVVPNKDKSTDITGFLNCKEFDLGTFLQNGSFGKVSCTASVAEHTRRKYSDLYIEDITVSKLEFNNYTYSNISASGSLKNSEFDGRIVSADPNLKFMLQGVLSLSDKTDSSLYQFKLSLGHADLAALNFDKRNVSVVRLNADADFTKTPKGNLLGQINISDIKCQSEDGTFNLGEIHVKSLTGGTRYMVGIQSSMLEARYKGSAFITDIIPEVEAALLNGKLDNLTRRLKKKPKSDGNNFDLDVRILDSQNLFDFLAPGIHISSGTTVKLAGPGDNTAVCRIRSDLLSMKDIYLQDLNADIDFQKNRIDATVGAQMFRSGSLYAANDTIRATCTDNCIMADLSYCNDPDSLDCASVRALVSFPNPKESNQKMLAHLGHSFLRVGGSQWNIDPSSIYFSDKHVKINGFNLFNDVQSLCIDGVLSENQTDTCSFMANNLDLSLLNMLMKNPLGIGGTVSADGKMTGALSRPDLLADVAIDSFCIAEREIGRIALKTGWDDTLHRINILAENQIEGMTPMTVSGYYEPETNRISTNIHTDRFDLGVLEPFISDLMTDISGSLSADISVSGPLDTLDIKSKNAHLIDFNGRLAYTQVPYTIDGYIDMLGSGIHLRDLTVKDPEKGTGVLSGKITHKHLKDFNLDLKIKADNLMGFDTDIADNDVFYGKAYASGTVTLTGPLSDLLLAVDVTTEPNTVVNIPLKSATTSTTSILTFVDNVPQPRISAIDSIIRANLAKEEAAAASGSNFAVNVKVRANDNAEINLELDSNSGDALKVRGTGNIAISVDDDFSIKGDYTVTEGFYRLALLGLVSRDFSINPGGTIGFTGDIMQSDLNLTASYNTKASIGALVADSTSTSLRRPVSCGIRISDKLANPMLGFDIKIDDLDPMTEARIANVLNTEESRMRQFLALIISGAFIPDEQSGIVNNTSVSYFNVTEIMSNQLNSIFQQLNIPLDLGFNYQPGEAGHDLFDVAVSTQLINNKVSINGNIGNRRYLTSSKNDVVGDVDVQVKLDKRGKLRLNLFSHSADEYSNYLDQTQRNGAGVEYQEEFDTFKELWQKYSGKKKKKATR